MSWAAAELKTVSLGDKRRNQRLIKIVEDLASKPSSSIPQACRNAAAVQAAYDFFSNPRIKASAIIAAHRESTIERALEHPLVLAIQDTTELDYTHHRSKQGIGPISNTKANGLKLHSVLCVSDAGVPLGLLHQQVWAREKKTNTTKKPETTKATETKESKRWTESLEITQNAIPSQVRVVTVCDREADIYQLLAQPRRIGSEYLIRAYHKRSVKTATTQTEVEKLQQAIIKTKPIGQLSISLKRTTKRQPRPAKLTIRIATYLLQPPESHLQQSQLKPLKIQVILAQEETPPPTEKPINWLLVTTLPVTDYQQACLCLKWYSYRWLIERYHYTLKSGCKIENIQLETAKRIERALATYAIVAWRLLWLTYLARNNPETPATQAFQSHEWQALYCITHQTSKPPSEPPTLQECVLWIAKLGGFLGRKTDGEPGVKTIWLGMRSLHDIAQSWLIAHAEKP